MSPNVCGIKTRAKTIMSAHLAVEKEKKRLEDIQLFRIALHHHLQCESSGCESIWSSLRKHNIQAYGGIVVVNAVQFAT